MAERERLHLGEGYSIFRVYNRWLMDVTGEGDRTVKSLATNEKMEAVQRAALHAEAKKWTPEEMAARAQERMQWLGQTTGTVPPPQIVPPPDPIALGKLMPLIRPQDAVLGGQQAIPIATQIAQEVLKTLKPQPPAVPILKAKEEYQKVKEGAISGGQVSNVERAVRRLLEETGVEFVRDITPRIINSFLAYLRDEEASGKARADKTIWNYYRDLSAFLSWCIESGHIFEHPMEKLKTPKVAPHDVEFYNLEEMGKSFKTIEGYRFEKIAGIAATAGLRRSEILTLEADNLDIPGRWIRIRNKPDLQLRFKKERGWKIKTRKPRDVPIFDECLRYLVGLPASGLLFPDVPPWGDVSKTNTKIGLSLQTFRRSWVTHLLGYVNPTTVAIWAGHSVEEQQRDYRGVRKELAFRFHQREHELGIDGQPTLPSIGPGRRERVD